MTESASPPRRRLGEAERKAALLEAARHAFGEAEYPEVSVARIARAAGASEALAHRYFGSKAGLYAAMVEFALGQLLDRQERSDAGLRPAAGGWTRLRASVRVYVGFVREGGNGWALLMRSPGSIPANALRVRDTGRREYRRLVAGMLGLPEEDSAVRIALEGYLGLVDSACLAWLEAGGRDEDRPALVEMAVAALAGALGTLGFAAQPPEPAEEHNPRTEIR